jgi:hypothetical protein
MSFAEFSDWRHGDRSAPGGYEGDAPDRDAGGSRTGSGLRPGKYETPQVIVIGNVHELTRGSASSGNKDANSQYYW